ncbi:MAG: nucleoside triphosphate pyrophosphohydrolase [Solirubrobacterales bacterium]|nr:nucleoside triphosphate pyrophosphohydrolase [Solirubrobacterales bacterium]HMT05783.1 MazG nucleotide pyrophosphohydrolase domain-containing protein [Solirubrobacterales bacterium]
MEAGELAGAIGRLDRVTRELREKCPWDREQDARSIVPHTVEEAYELAEAAREGDDAAMRDELGDVLFQVVFLSLLLEERGVGDLAEVASQLTEKLVRRHPHVYPPNEQDAAAGIETADDVRRQWDEIKRDVEGRQSEKDWRKPALPALIYANKVQWKLDPEERPANAGADNPDRKRDEARIGELLWEAVTEARSRGVDPELALRAEAERHAESLQK